MDFVEKFMRNIATEVNKPYANLEIFAQKYLVFKQIAGQLDRQRRVSEDAG